MLFLTQGLEDLGEEEGVFHIGMCALDFSLAGFGSLEEGDAVAHGVVGGKSGDWREGD